MGAGKVGSGLEGGVGKSRAERDSCGKGGWRLASACKVQMLCF